MTNVKKLKAEIEAIQLGCKHEFVVSKGLVETKIKNVFSGFYLLSHHNSSDDCKIRDRMIAAVCRCCELEIVFLPTEKCPICFQTGMIKFEKVELSKYFEGSDYDDYTCRCFTKKYTAFLYKCKNVDCDCCVIRLFFDIEKVDKYFDSLQYALG